MLKERTGLFINIRKSKTRVIFCSNKLLHTGTIKLRKHWKTLSSKIPSKLCRTTYSNSRKQGKCYFGKANIKEENFAGQKRKMGNSNLREEKGKSLMRVGGRAGGEGRAGY